MKNQQTFTDLEFGSRKRVTHCEEFLDTMDFIIPWIVDAAIITAPSSTKNAEKQLLMGCFILFCHFLNLLVYSQ